MVRPVEVSLSPPIGKTSLSLKRDSRMFLRCVLVFGNMGSNSPIVKISTEYKK